MSTQTPISPKSNPSAEAIERRIERAERQATFATQAGWVYIAALYAKLAADLRALLPAEPAR